MALKSLQSDRPKIDIDANEEAIWKVLGLSQGFSAVGVGTTDIPTAGTAVQLPNQAVRRVIITAHESNTGTVVVGDSTVVAALAGRKGLALYATQSAVFYVNNLNLLYVDTTNSGDDVHYYYEN